MLIYYFSMNKNAPGLEICPASYEDCHWLHELAQLRAKNEELKHLVTKDPLTGLFNYRYFKEILGNEIQRSIRSGKPLSLILVDLDHFKSINDRWGHEAGNQTLKTIASLFRLELRQSDIICRYGGEEFTILLPQTALPIAVKVAERLRLSIAHTQIEFEDQVFNLTASFGAGVYQQANEYTEDGFVDTVDQYLYQAKEQGRNQVCHLDFDKLKPLTAVSTDEKAALLKRRKDD